MQPKPQRGNAKRYLWVVVASGIFLYGSYWLSRPWLEPAYGIASIDLGNGRKIYLKRLDSGAVGPERLWLSEDPHRCSGFPDLNHDYLGGDFDNRMDYKVSHGELFVYDDAEWLHPKESSNMEVHFKPLAKYNYKSTAPEVFKVGEQPETITLSTMVVDNLRPCARFPYGLIDGSWRDWFDPHTLRFIHANEFSRR